MTISYDGPACVHVSATDVTSGRPADSEIVRQENLLPQLEQAVTADRSPLKQTAATASASVPPQFPETAEVEETFVPVPLCGNCGRPLDASGRCR